MSRNAHQEVDKFIAGEPATVKVCRIVVQKARDVSQAVAEKTGVRHESPQVLLIRNGQCIWNTSHRSITKNKLAEATE
ncbi:bacillithiol system redox-active protein YtxJ [Dethiobacter alkaliphilus]|uniref:bacillithiol system redox-active protein YtxJ n=1 Tax=Dethiobacter alkaliphilus TaxID=427926 RepID=UPI0022275E45|nr:bacillithiol system redox-active protein YtxJ [Dethiobacter alkaliphilus]MCW3489872.1 bacillithiol system redox-active protein YtxJ [Dethiobacter alkaliphilus]